GGLPEKGAHHAGLLRRPQGGPHHRRPGGLPGGHRRPHRPGPGPAPPGPNPRLLPLERTPVMGRGSEPADGLPVLLGGVALMAGEAVLGGAPVGASMSRSRWTLATTAAAAMELLKL